MDSAVRMAEDNAGESGAGARENIAAQAAELSVILPSFNEAANIPILVKLLDETLAGIAWEAIVVDDNSPDGTTEVARKIALRDPRIRVIRRIGRRGLSGACIEGILASSAPYVAVMDADLQHDETLLPKMLTELRTGDVDLVVASRKVDGGTTGEGLSKIRAWGSDIANSLAQKLLNVTLKDPMSGFFMVRREKAEALAPKLSPRGSRSCSTWSPVPMAPSGSANCLSPSASASTAKASWIRWSPSIISACFWRNISATSFPSGS